MKKVLSIVLVLSMVLAVAGCGKEDKSLAQRVYSISGECDEFRIINGIAVIGGEKETFYGGNLEIKTDNFKNICDHSFKYFIDNGKDNDTIMHNVVLDETSKYDLKNQETGQISGPVLNSNIDISSFKNNLYFELSITDENGESKTFTVPMTVRLVLNQSDTDKE